MIAEPFLSEVTSASKDAGPAEAPDAILVSRVENARDTATTHCEATEIIAQIRLDERLRETIARIREKFWSVMISTGNDRKAAKQAIDNDKKRLPAATWSGTFSHRKQDALLQHSGLLCADLDGLGDRIADVKEKLIKSIHLCALFISPTGDGLKAVFRVLPDAEKHKASFRAVEQHVRELTDLQIDQACSDVSRLCFLSYDPDVYLNEKAVELPVPVEAEAGENAVRQPVADEKVGTRCRIAEELLGDIDWNGDGSGFCTCPGEHLHTTPDADGQCIVYLDAAPTVKCFHAHCNGIIKGVNHELRSQVGKAECTIAPKTQNDGAAAGSSPILLPEIVSADQFLGQSLEIPPELVEGMIHQGTLVMFAGGSKACKSFTLLDLAISVSQGLAWWNRQVVKGRVLYVNFELTQAFLQQRLFILADAKGLADNDDHPLTLPGLDLWNLRGYAANVDELMPMIEERCRGEGYSMIIVDPIYKLIGGRNENAAGEMAEVLNHFDALAHETGAAVVYTHHFAKGLAANKEQLDRASGSGVFARHADAIITITPHEEEGAVVVEATLRNMPAPKPFVMRWSYPLMRIASELDPKKLKSKVGRPSKYDVQLIVACLPKDGLTAGQWKASAKSAWRMSDTTYYDLRNEALAAGLIEQRGDKFFSIPQPVSSSSDTSDKLATEGKRAA